MKLCLVVVALKEGLSIVLCTRYGHENSFAWALPVPFVNVVYTCLFNFIVSACQKRCISTLSLKTLSMDISF